MQNTYKKIASPLLIFSLNDEAIIKIVKYMLCSAAGNSVRSFTLVKLNRGSEEPSNLFKVNYFQYNSPKDFNNAE